MKIKSLHFKAIVCVVIFGNYTYAQTQSIGYAYYNIGNRMQRKLVVACCVS
jgi:hypothetical protein